MRRFFTRWATVAMFIALGGGLAVAVCFSHPEHSLTNAHSASIRGTVRIESKIQSKSLALNLYSRRGSSATNKKPQPPPNELQNVILYLEGRFPDSFEPPEKSPVVLQADETFVPHVLPVIRGTTVNFPNGDPFFHNVFSLSSAKNFDLGRYPKHQVRSVRFDRPGIVKVFCHIHSHMSAVVLVFDHPYFATANAEGKFEIENLPPGNYELVAWHERLKPRNQSVTLRAGAETRVDLVL
jgi:plastocyanin